MSASPLTEVVDSPLVELLRHRHGGRRGTALVFGDGETWRLVGPGASARSADVRFRDVARGLYRSIYRVRLGERLAAFDLNLAAGDGPALIEATVQLSWWVSDPIAAAAARVIDGEPLVRLTVGRRLAEIARTHPAASVRAAEQAAALELGAVSHLPDAGLSYGYGHTSFALVQSGREQLSELDRLRREIALEDARLQLQRRRILFFGELLRTGREGLLAYWLSRAPDDVREVYDRLPAAEPQLAWTGQPQPPALLPSGLLAELDEFESHQLRDDIAAALIAMGRDDLAATLDQGPAADRPGVSP